MNSNLKGEHINYLNLLTHTWVIIQINYKCCCFPLVRESFSPSPRPQNSNFAVKQSSRLLNLFIYLINYRKTFSFSVYLLYSSISCSILFSLKRKTIHVLLSWWDLLMAMFLSMKGIAPFYTWKSSMPHWFHSDFAV